MCSTPLSLVPSAPFSAFLSLSHSFLSACAHFATHSPSPISFCSFLPPLIPLAFIPFPPPTLFFFYLVSFLFSSIIHFVYIPLFIHTCFVFSSAPSPSLLDHYRSFLSPVLPLRFLSSDVIRHFFHLIVSFTVSLALSFGVFLPSRFFLVIILYWSRHKYFIHFTLQKSKREKEKGVFFYVSVCV